jgi:hypothetical protein
MTVAKKKAPRGRPRLYKDGTELYTLRIPKGMAVHIEAAIAHVKLATADVGASKAAILIDALKRRLRALENRDPNTKKTADKIEQAEARLKQQ